MVTESNSQVLALINDMFLGIYLMCYWRLIADNSEDRVNGNIQKLSYSVRLMTGTHFKFSSQDTSGKNSVLWLSSTRLLRIKVIV